MKSIKFILCLLMACCQHQRDSSSITRYDEELLGDLLMKLDQPQQALIAYELNLKLRPNRFNGLHGAAKAARLSGDHVKATSYYQILIEVARPIANERSELLEARDYLAPKS